jgi:thioredoxin-related protein
MKNILSFSSPKFSIGLILVTALLYSSHILAAEIGGAAESEIPVWFKESFLDLREDIAEAKEKNRRVMIYFHQNGCPYCAELVNNNFSQKPIVDFMNRHIDAVQINMWGDREVTHLDGKSYSEKQLAAKLKIWFTPTLLFFNETGDVVLRINGYYPPNRFMTALEYVAGTHESKVSFRDYSANKLKPATHGKLNKAPYFLKPPYNLAKVPADKPVAVFFEQKDCPACDTLHKEIMADNITINELKAFHTIQLDMWSNQNIVLFNGKTVSARKWAKDLGITYAPSAVLFDKGNEVIRIEAFLKGFHVQSVMNYVSSGSYKTEPSFQRFITKRAEHLLEQGHKVDIWK